MEPIACLEGQSSTQGLSIDAQPTLTMRCPCCTVVRTLADLRSRCQTLLACRYLTACSICHISNCTSSEDSWPLQLTFECKLLTLGCHVLAWLGWSEAFEVTDSCRSWWFMRSTYSYLHHEREANVLLYPIGTATYAAA